MQTNGDAGSSEWPAMSRGGCLAITNQLVKLLVHCPEGSKKSSRKPVYEMYYFRSRDAVEIVNGVA